MQRLLLRVARQPPVQPVQDAPEAQANVDGAEGEIHMDPVARDAGKSQALVNFVGSVRCCLVYFRC